ncbi:MULTISPECIES: hypothetical protein [unclassified Pseudomonas]|uniref:hypothetical protein n=1 Tax=unclassified Pseudomonas TaxID=196821 RepID=UPI0039182A94
MTKLAEALIATDIELTSFRPITSRPQLIYLVFGANTYHQEAVFSIASALAKAGNADDRPFDIQVFSDKSDPYRQLPVRVRALGADTRREWSGPHHYPFRCKHVLARKVLQESEKAVLIDTDTFFHDSPMKLFEKVRPDTLLCNAFQLRYSDCKETVLYTALAETLAERNLADDQMRLLNSGVIGLTRENAQTLDTSIELMDEFFPITPGAITLEEFCLGVAAYRSLKVEQCTDVIHHYWSRKQLFRAKVRAWLHKHGHNPTSAEALADTGNVSMRIPRPATWQRLMYKSATLAVPQPQRQFVREVLYGCCEHANEFDQACSAVWWEKAFTNAEKRMKDPIEPAHLRQWLDHWAVRRLLGRRRTAIYQHLIGSRSAR